MYGPAFFGKVFFGARFFGPAAAGGPAPEPPASDDYSYPVTEYFSKRPPPAKVQA